MDVFKDMRCSVFILFVFAQLNGAVASDSTECVEYGNFLSNRNSYDYQYVGEGIASAVGTSDRVAGMKYECQLNISPAQKCHFVLLVTKCSLSEVKAPGNQNDLFHEHQSSQNFNELMKKNPFMFQMSDGNIVNIKHTENEVLWILNIKRAIASSFLISKSSSKQTGDWQLHTDVQGTCPQKLIRDSEDESKLKTEKKMLFCRLPERKYWELSPWSLFNNMSFIQNLINSSASCEYSITLSGIQYMNCTESIAIMLESTHKTTTAVQTNVRKTMTLLKVTSVANIPLPTTLTKTSQIVYEYDELTTKPPKSSSFDQEAFKMIADMVQTTQKETRLFTITMFSKFLAHIRTSPDLGSLVTGIRACSFMTQCTQYQKERALAFLQDALVQCNTPVCVKGFRSMLPDVTPLYFNLAMVTWSHSKINDPQFAEQIMMICKMKQSRTCWLALGTIIGSYVAKHEDMSYRQFPDSIYNGVQHMVDQFGDNCNSIEKTEEIIEQNLGMIQALNNIGYSVYKVSPTVSSKVFNCIKNEKLASDSMVAAIQLRGIGPKNSAVIDQFWNIVANEDAETRIRIEAYMVMANHYGSYETGKKILDLFSTMKSKQVKSFIASHIGKLVSNDLRDSRRNTDFNPVFREDGPRPFGNKELSDQLMILFEEEKYDGLLEEVKNYHGRYSEIKSYSHFFEFDSWRKYRNSFGYLFEDSIILQNDNSRPSFISTNHTIELFNDVLNFFEAGASLEDIFTTLNKENTRDNLKYYINAMRNVVFDKNAGWNLDKLQFQGYQGISQSLLDNMKALHSKLSKLMKSDPHMMSYVKLMGKYAGIVTLSDVKKISLMIQQEIASLPLLIPKLSHGVHRDNHRNIKVIEAYHQFPTSIGLPLNWTTDASLSVSVRTGIKINMQHGKANFYVKPSGALTFINSMFFVLPTITNAGIQANSSAFTSTSWKINAQVLSKDKISIGLEAPTDTQEILNLFRYNYIIRGDVSEKLPDYEIDRVTKVWCKEGLFKKITGLKACHQRSYADVTNLIKPWFPMAGWAKWRLAIFRADQNLKSYVVTLNRAMMSNSMVYKIDAEAPGSYLKRTVKMTFKVGETTEFEMKVPESPKFKFAFSNKKASSPAERTYHTSVTLNDELGKLYKLSYDSHFVVQRMRGNFGPNTSPKNKYVNSVIQDYVFYFVLPHEKYGWTYKLNKKDNGLNGNMLFSYEKLAPHTSWLEPILPGIFWEIGKMKSWVLLKAAIASSSQTGITSTKGLFHLNIPRTDLEIDTIKADSKLGNSFILKAKKIEVDSKQLKSFADFTYSTNYELSNKGERMVFKKLNLTVPLHSLALENAVKMLGETTKYSFTCTFSKMVPKASSDWFHIGWWHKDTHQRFNHKSWSTTLDVTTEDLSNKWPIVSKLDGLTDLTSYGGHTFTQDKIDKAMWVDSVFIYPIESGTNSITFRGNLITDHTTVNGFSMFRDAQVHSKVHGKTYKWQYYTLWTSEKMKLFGNAVYHNSIKDLNAQYSINLEHIFSPWNIQLFHSLIFPHLDYFASISSQPEPKQDDIILTIESKSDIWNTLNSRVDQYFHFGDDGWESMNFTSPLANINTTVDWTKPWYRSYNKKITLNSLTEFLPSLQTDILFKDKGTYNADLEFKDSGNVLKTSRETHNSMKVTDFNVDFVEKGVQKSVLWTELRILSEHVIVGNVTFNYKPMMGTVMNLYQRSKKFASYYETIEKNPDHPMNKFISPFLDGKTVFNYRTDTLKDIQDVYKNIYGNAYGVIKTWDVFYAPSFAIPVNAWKQLNIGAQNLDVSFRKTFTGWAWYYFNMPELLNSQFQQAVSNEIMKQIVNSVIIPTKDGFMFMIVHPFHWLRFDETPKVTPELRDFFTNRKIDKVTPKYPEFKTAIVLKDGQVFTFDDKTYRFNAYPVDGCIYLLAHDVKVGAFSILKTKDSIIVVLQNNFYRIDNENKVYVNGKLTPSNLPINISPTGKRDPTKATISGMENVVEVNTTAGLYVICDTVQHLCVIKLSHSYSGKTAGLLGNFDGESYNDFMLNTGKRTEDLFTFVSSYEVSGIKGCNDPALMKNKATTCSLPSVKNVQKCDELFNYKSLNSENYYCFKKVFAGPFSDACKQQAKCADFSACDVQSAYVASCYNQGVKIQNCIDCEGTHPVQQQWKEKTTRKVQVALIVDQNSLMFVNNRHSAGLKNLLEKIDATFLIKKGYSSRSYALVSFGQRETSTWNRPQVHLASNKVWQSLNTMVKSSLKTLSFENNKRSDPVKALEFAAENLTFEAESSKVYIVVTVDDTMGSASIGNTLKKLESSGISLYTIASFPSVLKGKHIFGVRGDGYVFPHPPEAKKQGKEVLFVTVPAGPLAKLTSAMHGSIFQRKFLEENLIATYFTEFAEEILAKVVKEETKEKTCSCVQDWLWNVKTICRFD